ncbi:MAG: type III-B CRISPR module RAMP protein Cmr4 [wastewater metagenome]|nr:type III-B CRISPR module RAMP protein Cmr4 [Candidatus Loosdrechtia aerotolerans]
MFKKALPFFMIVETPLHAGSSDALGVVDLPIQRERHTGFPKIESSGLKGSIREVFEDLRDIKSNKWIFDSVGKKFAQFPQISEKWEVEKNGEKEVKSKSINGITYELTRFEESVFLAFGPEEGDAHAGALGFTDARLLLFPVKSMKGVFAWITCPHILEKLKKEMELAGISNLPSLPNENTVPHNCSLVISSNNIVLEEYTFQVNRDENKNGNCSKFAEWLANNVFPKTNGGKDPYKYWREKMEKDIVTLTDNDFRDFVNLSTEVVARTKINNETGTVQSGALFYEEYLPQESILYSLALASPIFKEKDSEKGIFKQNGKNEEDLVLEFFKAGLPEVIQIGGNATIGKGIVRTRVLEVKNG